MKENIFGQKRGIIAMRIRIWTDTRIKFAKHKRNYKKENTFVQTQKALHETKYIWTEKRHYDITGNEFYFFKRDTI